MLIFAAITGYTMVYSQTQIRNSVGEYVATWNTTSLDSHII